ncbi:cell division protein ZapD [Candidatus Pantoea edessiphila]|uniref:Cell division protein ZapD n=1 Tax=Candidatus Pantoea edessiphila TaxID=2044610 RepID=A0A2P5SY25_9GAMM|nr:cell division protein ZapD [Candidatus Pantoea edessiphila]MBK4775585.1 cell division protein ZapD [Pantoea sp. Edef]PPI87236.1 cell division protein ZapD [Candidatus Pantoea edessiphila]
MSTSVLFEHPLSEKMRTWLRIEFIINQLDEIYPINKTIEALIFFRLIDELLDIFERGDIRTQLLKELERQKQKLLMWSNIPGVDIKTIDQINNKLKIQSDQLIKSFRIGQQLREDSLISIVRQRLNIPGGCCSFDLPYLHIWLHFLQENRNNQVKAWIETLSPVHKSLAIILNLIRQGGTFRTQTSLNGFYQDNAIGADLLRIQLETQYLMYPKISGHKSRYSIRFVPLDKEHNVIPLKFNFQLACC